MLILEYLLYWSGELRYFDGAHYSIPLNFDSPAVATPIRGQYMETMFPRVLQSCRGSDGSGAPEFPCINKPRRCHA